MFNIDKDGYPIFTDEEIAACVISNGKYKGKQLIDCTDRQVKQIAKDTSCHERFQARFITVQKGLGTNEEYYRYSREYPVDIHAAKKKAEQERIIAARKEQEEKAKEEYRKAHLECQEQRAHEEHAQREAEQFYQRSGESRETLNGHLEPMSVTQRIHVIHQPRLGYLPIKLFEKVEYAIHDELNSDAIISPGIQGCAVDYLVRFMSGEPLETAFEISLKGAKILGNTEYYKALDILQNVHGLDHDSVFNAIKLAHYDVVFRRGAYWYVNPSTIEYGNIDIQNITVLVHRTLSILSHYSPITETGFTFNGGYTPIVLTGDGDYLSNDTMWDLKCSEKKPGSAETCQLFVYLILGYHAFENEKYRKLKYIGFINPILNTVYRIRIDDIPEEIFRTVNNKVVGYADTPVSEWKPWSHSMNDIDRAVYYPENVYVKDVIHYTLQPDGIFQISWNEYLALLSFATNVQPSDIKRIADKAADTNIIQQQSKFEKLFYSQYLATAFCDRGFCDVDVNNNIDHVNVLKKQGYYMFIGESAKGELFVLDGARKRKAQFTVQYYYNNMIQYAEAVRSAFADFWKAQDDICNFISSIKPSKEFVYNDTRAKMAHLKQLFDFFKIDVQPEDLDDFKKYFTQLYGEPKFAGYGHGSIVDLDFFNHIYLNPFDGKTTPYFALSMHDKWAYQNVQSLIAAKRPEMLEDFLNKKSKFTEKQNALIKMAGAEIIPTDNTISLRPVFIADTNIYGISTRFETIRHLRKENVIRVWYDNFLHPKDKSFYTLLDCKQYIPESDIRDGD